MRRAFTLVELLVVIAILAILAAILFPVFARAKAAAKQSGCISNLSQIGKGISMYMADYDDRFPFAVDPSDKFAMEIWNDHPDWQVQIPNMPMFHEAVQPYIKSKEVFKCPSDNGSYILDSHYPEPFVCTPTTYSTYGSSYLFRTEIAFRAFSSTDFQLPANVNVLFDASGHWHGSRGATRQTDTFQTYLANRREYRYNTLYGDMHVKSLQADQLQQAWATDL